MKETGKIEMKSIELASKLYDSWVKERQTRPDHKIPKTKEDLKELRLINFENQLATPRRKHLEQLKKSAPEMSTASVVALLVMLELPPLEISTLLHKLNFQLNKDPNDVYFSQTNQQNNCGSGCGSGCAFMSELPWVEQINTHMDAKPFSIDPFNEVGLPEKERDSLLIKDFLRNYEALSESISEGINKRYFK